MLLEVCSFVYVCSRPDKGRHLSSRGQESYFLTSVDVTLGDRADWALCCWRLLSGQLSAVARLASPCMASGGGRDTAGPLHLWSLEESKRVVGVFLQAASRHGEIKINGQMFAIPVPVSAGMGLCSEPAELHARPLSPSTEGCPRHIPQVHLF